MIVAQTVKNFFVSETFVQMAKNGEFASKTCWWLFGRMIRWVTPSKYFDLTTIWKAHLCVTTILTSPLAAPQLQIKLTSLKTAVATLTSAEHAKLGELVKRIDAEVAHLAPHEGQAPLSIIASELTKLLSGKDPADSAILKARLHEYTKEQKQQVEHLVIEYYFEPLLMQAFSIMMKSKLAPEIYYQAFLKVQKAYITLSQTFGRGELVKILDQYHFQKALETHFLFPLLENWVKTYKKKDKGFVDALMRIEKYIDDVSILFPDLIYGESWGTIRQKFKRILKSFYSKPIAFSLMRPFSPFHRPKKFSAAYAGDNKQQIEEWLSSIQDVEALGELARQLRTRGLFIGENLLTEKSLHIPPEITGMDRQILLCWGVFQAVAALFKENGVKEPEAAAKCLMTFATLEYASVPFFSNLGKFVYRALAGYKLTPEQQEQRMKIGISFSCEGGVPLAGWEQIFHRIDRPDDPGFYVRGTIQKKGEGFSEDVKSRPCVFNGSHYHIEESEGAYTLCKDSYFTAIRSAFGSEKIFFFSKEGVSKFNKSVDENLKMPSEETVVSLRHLEKDIRDFCFMKNIPYSKRSLVRKVLAKVDVVKQDVFQDFHVAFGKSLAHKLFSKYEGQDITFAYFLSRVDEELADIKKSNVFPAKIFEGFFFELKESLPLHFEALVEKERVTQFSLMQEEIEGPKTNADPRIKYIHRVHALRLLIPYYIDQFPDLLEKMYIEQVSPYILACPEEEKYGYLELLTEKSFKQFDVALGRSIGLKFLEEHAAADMSLQDLIAWIDQEILEMHKRNLFPAKILAGFFSEIRNKFPQFLDSLNSKERDAHLEMMQEWIDKEITGADAKVDYIQCIQSLQFFKSIYNDQYSAFFEKIFVERAAPFLAKSMKEEMEKAEDERFQELENDIYTLKALFPQPQTLLLKNVFDAGPNCVFWLGLEIGNHLKEGVQQMDAWFSKCCSPEQAAEVAEGMRRNAGLKYGASLAVQIGDLKGAQIFETIEKERAAAPNAYSQVVRGMLSALDHLPDQDQVNDLCKRYADRLVEHFEEASFFQSYFKPFLCGPYAESSSRIVEQFMKTIFEKGERVTKKFFTCLVPAVQSEIKLMFDEDEWEEKQKEYLGSLAEMPV
jgi:hypothetical protein